MINLCYNHFCVNFSIVKIFLFSMVFFDLFKKVSFTFILDVMLKSAFEMPKNSMCPILPLKKITQSLKITQKYPNGKTIAMQSGNCYIKSIIRSQNIQRLLLHKWEKDIMACLGFFTQNIDPRLVGFNIFHLIRHAPFVVHYLVNQNNRINKQP